MTPHDAPSGAARRPATPWPRALLALAAAIAFAATAGPSGADDSPAGRLRQIKELQREYVMRPAAKHILPPGVRGDGGTVAAPAPDSGSAARPAVPAGPDGARARKPRGESQRPAPPPGPRELKPGLGEPESAGLPAGGERTLIETNVSLSNPADDAPGAYIAQDEPSLAVFGNKIVAAWNDGEGFFSGGSRQGYGISTDGGATFTDLDRPLTPFGMTWQSDPVITVNEKTGEFFYCALLDPSVVSSGVGVMRGTFTGDVFSWDSPNVVRSVSLFSGFLDKCWLAADSLTGNLYVVYTEFTSDSNWVVFQRSTDGGRIWSDPVRLSPNTVSSQVQGARPAVGPNGEVYVVWKEIDIQGEADYFRIRRSNDGGINFGPQRTVASHYDNFGTGAPGFNRERGITFPGITVDRTSGPRRGRVYVTWNESTNWFDAIGTLGNGGSTGEVEDNDGFDGANAFNPGVTLSGNLEFNDTDVFSFLATRGFTYVFWCNDPPPAYYRMRITCTDQDTELAMGGDLESPAGGQGLVIWTAPESGTYYLQMIYAGATAGDYTVRTGIDASGANRGRDARDIFVASSADGATWTEPVRVNKDAPWFDNWLPEVAVAGNGTVYTMWYDWRDAVTTCGGASHVYMSRSDDGGNTWSSLGPLSDTQTAWSSVRSNAIPNQGDYLGLFANRELVTACWTDGRRGNPDIIGITLPLDRTQVAVENITADMSSVHIRWRAFRPGGISALTAGVYRRFGTAPYDSVGTIAADAFGNLVYEDQDVTAGVYYQYELRIEEGGVSRFVGFASALVPTSPPVFGLGLPRPNPTKRDVFITFTLPDALPARLELLDPSGRVVRSQEVGSLGPGDHLRNLAAGPRLRPGIYFVRLTRAGTTLARRVSVVP